MPVYGVSLLKNGSKSNAQLRCLLWHPTRHNSGNSPCPFIVHLHKSELTGRWSIDAEASTWTHSHGPAPEILRDPTWRPRIINADARQALGMPPWVRKSSRDRAAAKREQRRRRQQDQHSVDEGGTPELVRPSLACCRPPPLMSCCLRKQQVDRSHVSSKGVVVPPSQADSAQLSACACKR